MNGYQEGWKEESHEKGDRKEEGWRQEEGQAVPILLKRKPREPALVAGSLALHARAHPGTVQKSLLLYTVRAQQTAKRFTRSADAT